MVASGLKAGSVAMWPARLPTFQPWVSYQYTYAEMPFVGSHVGVYDRFLATVDKESATAMSERLAQTTTVYRDPQAPSRSCLDNRLRWRHYNHLLTYGTVGILILLIGLGIWYLPA